MNNNDSISIATPSPTLTSRLQKLAVGVSGLGILLLLIVWAAGKAVAPVPMSLVAVGLVGLGVWLFIREEYLRHPAGIKNNGVWLKGLTARGIWGWLLGVVITGFYICLYWFPEYLTGLIQLFDPMSWWLRNTAANQWFVYGVLYTGGVVFLGVKFIYKYRHNPY